MPGSRTNVTTKMDSPASNPHGLDVEQLTSWEAFKERLARKYLTYALDDRRKFLYRGHSKSTYELKPTIDRLGKRFRNDDERNELLSQLVNEFRRSSYGLQAPIEFPRTDEEWEYLGRHHGLPTSILDWTRSPYVAAYFAYEGADATECPWVSIWVLHTVKNVYEKPRSSR